MTPLPVRSTPDRLFFCKEEGGCSQTVPNPFAISSSFPPDKVIYFLLSGNKDQINFSLFSFSFSLSKQEAPALPVLFVCCGRADRKKPLPQSGRG